VNIDLSSDSADFALIGENASDWFGGKVVPAGDINADGLSDIAMSATGDDTSGFNTGAVYIFFGQSSIIDGVNKIEDQKNAFKINGEEGRKLFLGRALAGGGDVDGDGKDDLLVVGTKYDEDLYCSAYLFTGDSLTTAYASSTGTMNANSADVKFYGKSDGMKKASSVTILADRNGDGSDELAIGCNSKLSGKSYVFSGGALTSSGYDIVDDADMVFVGSEISRYSKTTVVDLGDVTGDKVENFMIGSTITNYQNSKGMAAVINYDLAGLPVKSALNFVNDEYSSFFGTTLGWKRFSSSSYAKKYDYDKSPTTGWFCTATGKYSKCYATWTHWAVSSWDDGTVTKDSDGLNVTEGDLSGYVDWCSSLIAEGSQPTLYKALAANSKIPNPKAGNKVLYCPAELAK
jgi:hypothetical protein